VAARGQVRKAFLDRLLEATPGAAEKGSIPSVEAELPPVHPDEVEHRAYRLAFGQPQATAQLLEEECRAVRGTQQQKGVNGGNVDTFVEKVHGEDDLKSSRFEVDKCPRTLVVRCVAPHGAGGNAEFLELSRHVPRVGHADAEPQAPDRRDVINVIVELLIDESGPRNRADILLGQRLR
jgi:hypothetical protein